MTVLYIVCEGQTEATFADELLKPHLESRGVFLKPSLIGRPGKKGGNVTVARLADRVRRLLDGSHNPYCTSFFDFYGLPSNFPGKTDLTANMTPDQKSDIVCQAMKQALGLEHPLDSRFFPYVQMHEFEGLLFSDPAKFARGIDRQELAHSFAQIRNQFESPEEIDDGWYTAPSKRIAQLFSEEDAYEKVIMGTLAALEIGLPSMRDQCPLFRAWLRSLESLA